MTSSLSHLVTQLQDGIQIDSNTSHQRLDRFLRKLFRPYKDISLAMIFKAIRTGEITLQVGEKEKKTKESYLLQLGDTIVFHHTFLELISHKNPISKEKAHHQAKTYQLTDFQSWIISEDEEWLVLNKPAGIMIHPTQDAYKNNEASLYDLIKQYYSSRGFSGSLFQPNVAYRLDKETSGLVIVAKTYAGLQYLNKIIREHRIHKYYQAIVVGRFPSTLEMTKSLKKVVDKQFGRGKMVVCDDTDPYALQAKTIGTLEKTRIDPLIGPLSLVKFQLFSGRMHQIRVHSSDAGFPIVGDIVYGLPSVARKAKKNYHISRQLLHCRRYSFLDANGQEISFEAPLADDIQSLADDIQSLMMP